MKDMTEQIVLDETPEVKRALDRAASAWPDQSRAELLVRLVSVGADHLDDESSRLQARRKLLGRFTGRYDSDHVSQLRDEWPN